MGLFNKTYAGEKVTKERIADEGTYLYFKDGSIRFKPNAKKIYLLQSSTIQHGGRCMTCGRAVIDEDATICEECGAVL